MLKCSVILGGFFRQEMQASGLLVLEGGTSNLCRNVDKHLPNNLEEGGNQ